MTKPMQIEHKIRKAYKEKMYSQWNKSLVYPLLPTK